jgi:polar amino acid transport system substrate-binding protein
MKKSLRFLLMMVALLAIVATADAQQAPDPRVADLVRAGKVRVGLFPPQYIKDPATGELKSVWVEIARALAARIGVQVVLLEHPTPPKVVECLKAGACDVVFLPFDARAANVGDFSSPFIQFEYTLLVPAGSSIRSIPDADRTGVRIAAVRNHASTITLSLILKQANLVYAETPDPTFDLLRAGHADVMASTRNALLEYSTQLRGSRVLEDHYGANLNRVVIPKGHAGRLSYVNEFVEEAKASGLVQKAIDRAGPRGVTVAPPGNPTAQK